MLVQILLLPYDCAIAAWFCLLLSSMNFWFSIRSSFCQYLYVLADVVAVQFSNIIIMKDSRNAPNIMTGGVICLKLLSISEFFCTHLSSTNALILSPDPE